VADKGRNVFFHKSLVFALTQLHFGQTMNMPVAQFEDESSTDVDSLGIGNDAIELAARYNGPSCDKCGKPMKSDMVTVCRHCGWYASLGQFVEVDRNWETYCDDDEPQAAPVPKSHAEIWSQLLPPWAWVVIATVSAVVVESIVARLVTAESSALRTTWSLSQLVLGIIAFLSCHLFIFMFAIADDADTGALDIILKPLKLWFRAFANLPSRLWVTDTAAAGLTGVVMSIVVIGGLPYERLWDWGFEKPKKSNLMGAVVSQVQKVEGKGADNLEDAVKDFANTQNLEQDKKPVPPPKPRQQADCVILGYRVDAEGKLQSLILGTALKDKLVYACSITPQLSSEEVAGLTQMLNDTRSHQPYLPIQVNAQWVVPTYSCRISYESQEKSGRLMNPRWEEFLGTLD
jgi:hypothetical protein